MVMTDPIADFLTQIRNACMANHERVDVPSSKIKLSIAKLLKEEGYINNYKLVKDKRQGILRVYLKYDNKNVPIIEGLERISKPSCRVYVRHDKIPYVLNGYGTVQIGRPANRESVENSCVKCGRGCEETRFR
jgi:small subunit ribosomal protein S8